MKQFSWRLFPSIGLALLAALFLALPAQAQQTLGSINGTVTDSTGAAVPNAVVTVTDKAINVVRTTKSGKDGYYQIFNLPVGTYSVEATMTGFQKLLQSGISVKEATATTVNAKLPVGGDTQTVEVTSNPMLNATDTTNGYTLDSRQIEETPLATGSFTQLAVLSPGVNEELLSGIGTNAGLGNQPIWANGQRDTSNTFQVDGVDASNLFNGKTSSGDTSQRYNFNIGGGSTSSTSAAGAGTVAGANATATSSYGSNGNSIPSPPQEFLQELRVNTSMYDAQQGATSGAQIDANTRGGTNQYHGQVYSTYANNYLDADPYFFKQQAILAQDGIGSFPVALENPDLHRWTLGGTMGGPIKKDKLFFFIGYQHLYDSDQSTGLSQFQVPLQLTDDRSAAGLQTALNSWYGTTHTATISPIANALLTAKSPYGGYLIPSNQTNNFTTYLSSINNVTLINHSTFSADQANAGLDYQVTNADRLSFKYYYQNDPTQSPFSYSTVYGFPGAENNGAQLAVLDNTTTLGPKLNLEERLGWVREDTYAYSSQTQPCDPTLGCAFGIGAAGTNVPQNTMPGLLISESGFNSTASGGLKVGPYSYFANEGYYQNRLNPSANLIAAEGKHTIVTGGGFSDTQLNIINHRNGTPIIREKTFATFYTGAAPTSVGELSSVINGSNHDNANRYYKSNEGNSYVQDKWQLMSNLSITAGVRWDYHGGMTEKYGNMFNFDPSTYNVTGTDLTGFTVINSGFVVAGNSPYKTAGATNSTLAGRQWGFSPRLGLAFAPKEQNGKLVIRTGFGLYYDRGENFQYLSQPAGNGSGGPYGVTEAAPLSVFSTSVGSNLANPVAAIAPPTGLATSITQSLQNTLNSITGPGTTNTSIQRCSALDSEVNYADCGYTLNFGAYNKANKLPYTMNFSLNLQYQFSNDVMASIGYTGNRGRHSVIPIPFNEPQIATASNPAMILGASPHSSGETASYGFNVFDLNSPNAIPSKYGDPTFNPIPGEYWNTEDGGNSDLRAPYVGFSPNSALFTASGVSAYDALETHIEKRLSHWFSVGANYTFSHTHDEQSDLGLFFTGDDPANLRDSYGPADFDRTHVFTADFQIELPKFESEGSWKSHFTNGWSLNGLTILQSGEPFSLYEFYGAVGSVRFGDYPTLMNPVLPVADKHKALTGNSGSHRVAGGAYQPAIDPSQIAIQYLAPGQKGVPVQSGTSPADTYETDFVPGQRNIFRQSSQKQLNLSFNKGFKISDRFSLAATFNVFNILNTPSLDVPNNQTEIRADDSCVSSTVSATGATNCANVVNYGQVGTTLADQGTNNGRGTAGSNLDRLPATVGTGSSTTVPITSAGASFGSVTNTIGSNRLITWGIRLNY